MPHNVSYQQSVKERKNSHGITKEIICKMKTNFYQFKEKWNLLVDVIAKSKLLANFRQG